MFSRQKNIGSSEERLSKMLTYRFIEEAKGVFRLKVPFDNLYTSVFLVECEEGPLLVDCATTDSDVDEVILPALTERGLSLSNLRALVLTHSHSDHDGGRKRLLEHCPTLEVFDFHHFSSLSGVFMYPLAGHTRDSIGLYVERCGLLISGDGLQGDGVGKYRLSLQDEEAYQNTLEKVMRDERVCNILFSHAYEPWCCDFAFGREAVLSCLLACKESFEQRKRQS